MKKRLDQHLVDQGLAPSKTKAQEMIEAGQVSLISRSQGVNPEGVQLAKKPSQKINPDSVQIKIAEENLLKFVSRSGFKLEGALEELNIEVNGYRVLDVGQSTGGFTDCLLQRGATHVTGVDIGLNELANKFLNDNRVSTWGGVNARNLREFAKLKGEKFNLVVVDLSFISLEKILSEIPAFISSGGYLLALVKPQFEVGAVNIGKNGIVKSQEAVAEVEIRLKALVASLGFVGIRYITAKIKGRDGNQEFFIYGERK